jgi:hypothetical protein
MFPYKNQLTQKGEIVVKPAERRRRRHTFDRAFPSYPRRAKLAQSEDFAWII